MRKEIFSFWFVISDFIKTIRGSYFTEDSYWEKKRGVLKITSCYSLFLHSSFHPKRLPSLQCSAIQAEARFLLKECLQTPLFYFLNSITTTLQPFLWNLSLAECLVEETNPILTVRRTPRLLLPLPEAGAVVVVAVAAAVNIPLKQHTLLLLRTLHLLFLRLLPLPLLPVLWQPSLHRRRLVHPSLRRFKSRRRQFLDQRQRLLRPRSLWRQNLLVRRSRSNWHWLRRHRRRRHRRRQRLCDSRTGQE